MIIDCHVHLNNYTEEKVARAENLRRLREQMEKWRLDHCIVLTSYTVNPDRPSAAEVLDELHGDPRIHVVEGVWAGADVPVRWENVEERLAKGLTKGVKLYPGYEHSYPQDPGFRPAYELAAKYRVPVMVHTGDTFAPRGKLKFSHPLHVDDVAVDWPDVQFIICHLGNPWLMDTAEVLYKNPNVHADISGLVLEEFDARLEKYLRDELEAFIAYSGDPEKLLFGTDWPLVRMGPYLRFVEGLGLDPEHRDLLMWRNAARLFAIDVDAAGPVDVPTPGRPRAEDAPVT